MSKLKNSVVPLFVHLPEDPLRYDSCWADSVGGGGGAAADSCLEGVAAAAAGTAGGRATLFTSQLVYRSGGGHGKGTQTNAHLLHSLRWCKAKVSCIYDVALYIFHDVSTQYFDIFETH